MERPMAEAAVFAQRPHYDGARRHLSVFAVGDRTADGVLDVGYRNVRSTNGDIRDLQTLIVDALPPRRCRIVHFGAREAAGDLKGHLQRFGYLVDRRVVYVAGAVGKHRLVKVMTDLPSINAIMVYSPRAAERVATLLSETDWSGKIWCISEACAHKLANVRYVEIHVAPKPTELAMMDLVAQDSRCNG